MTYYVSRFIEFYLLQIEPVDPHLQLRKRDTGFANTHRIVVRLIRLSIETGCVTGQHIYFYLVQ